MIEIDESEICKKIILQNLKFYSSKSKKLNEVSLRELSEYIRNISENFLSGIYFYHLDSGQELCFKNILIDFLFHRLMKNTGVYRNKYAIEDYLKIQQLSDCGANPFYSFLYRKVAEKFFSVGFYEMAILYCDNAINKMQGINSGYFFYIKARALMGFADNADSRFKAIFLFNQAMSQGVNCLQNIREQEEWLLEHTGSNAASRGSLLSEQQNYQEAFLEYHLAIKLNEQHGDIYCMRAMYYFILAILAKKIGSDIDVIAPYLNTAFELADSYQQWELKDSIVQSLRTLLSLIEAPTMNLAPFPQLSLAFPHGF